MSLVDKFQDQAQPVFSHSFDRDSARRQFRVSIFLIVAMAVSAFVLGFAMPVDKPVKATDVVGHFRPLISASVNICLNLNSGASLRARFFFAKLMFRKTAALY